MKTTESASNALGGVSQR